MADFKEKNVLILGGSRGIGAAIVRRFTAGGAGVAFKVAWRLATLASGGPRAVPHLRDLLLELLPFAALGAIADVAYMHAEAPRQHRSDLNNQHRRPGPLVGDDAGEHRADGPTADDDNIHLVRKSAIDDVQHCSMTFVSTASPLPGRYNTPPYGRTEA